MAVYIARGSYSGGANVPSGPAQPSFSDVPTDHWACKYIEACKSMGIIAGYGSEYRPSLPVDRAQMAVFFSRRAVEEGWVPSGGPHFADVPENHWAYPYVEYGLQLGLVAGYPDGLYHPESPVTRDRTAVFMGRAYHVEPMP